MSVELKKWHKNESANTFHCNRYTASPALGNTANSSLPWPICLDLLLVVGILGIKNLNIKIDSNWPNIMKGVRPYNIFPKWLFTLKYVNRRRVESVFIIHVDLYR